MAGKVILIGAGPGDAGLLTLKGLKELRRADVVVFDRLVDEEILSLIPPTARRIDVGKRAADHPVPQGEINRILVREGQKEQRVVRLKGGDCFVFGRGGEEVEALKAAKVPFEVVPGVTSALAAPAYGGIPATHRDFCASVHIITGHRRAGEELRLDYEALVRLNGTLIFLMSVATFGEIAKGLMRAGLPQDFPCAIVENGTRPEQRRLSTMVSDAESCIEREHVVSPAIFIVGKVCTLAEEMDWFDVQPLKGIRVLVARPREDSHRMAELLREQGARVWELPASKANFLDFDLPQEDSNLILPDAEAVGALEHCLKRHGRDWRALSGMRLVCKSRDARQALAKLHLREDEPDDTLPSVLLSREDCPNELPNVKVISAWRRELPEPVENLPEADWVVFTTTSGIQAFAAAAQGQDKARWKAACIGPQTLRAAQALGMTAYMAKEPTLESVAELLSEYKKGE